MAVEVRRVGPEAAAEVLAVVRSAFGARPALDPPAPALAETKETIAAKLTGDRGLLACLEGEPVGALLLDPQGSTTYLRRFGVTPAAQGHGVAGSLIEAALREATASEEGSSELAVVAREELPATVRFWKRQGFREIRRETPNVELRRSLRTQVLQAPDAEAMRELGRRLTAQLAAGDLIVLTGDLGAGKTTFVRHLLRALGVRGRIKSPTYAIVEPHMAAGSPHVHGQGALPIWHFDFYRFDDPREWEDAGFRELFASRGLKLVEWPEKAAGLLPGIDADIHIEPDAMDLSDDDDPPRLVRMSARSDTGRALLEAVRA